MRREKNGGPCHIKPSRPSCGFWFLFWAWRGSVWAFWSDMIWHIHSQYHSNDYAAGQMKGAKGRAGGLFGAHAIIKQETMVGKKRVVPRVCEQWLDSGHILRTEPIGFPDRLEVRCERKSCHVGTEIQKSVVYSAHQFLLLIYSYQSTNENICKRLRGGRVDMVSCPRGCGNVRKQKTFLPPTAQA